MTIIIFITAFLCIGVWVRDWSRITELRSDGSEQESAEGVQSIVDSALIDTKSGKILEKKLKGVIGVFVVGTDEISVSPDVYQDYSEGDTVEYFSVSATVPEVEKDVGSDTNISFVTAVEDCPDVVDTIKEQLTSKVKVQAEKNSEALLTYYEEHSSNFAVCVGLALGLLLAAIVCFIVPLF